MFNPLYIYITFLWITLSFVYANEAKIKRTNLESINWSNFTYDQLHELAVKDQVANYVPALESLHTRETISLNGLWDFCFDDLSRGFEENWPEYNVKEKCNQDNFFRMPVPSAFNDIISNETAKNYVGWVWYQKHISIMKQEEEKLFIHFENVNYMAIVWIQQISPIYRSDKDKTKPILIGSHVGGYLPFTINFDHVFRENFTRAIKLTIAVNNMLTNETIPSGKMIDLSKQVGRSYFKFEPDFDFFHFSGIMGEVSLVKLPNNHISSVDWFYKEDSVLPTFNVCFNRADPVKLFDATYLTDDLQPITGHIYNFNSELCLLVEPMKKSSMAGYNNNYLIKNNASLGFVQLVLWGPKYSINNFTYQQEDVVEIKFTSFKNFPDRSDHIRREKKLGDARGKLQGFGMHHETYFSGRTMSLASIMKDLYLLKNLGVNVIRTSHYPYSPAYLDACDELGIKVIAECQAVGLNTFSGLKLTLHKQLLREIMVRDHHHPSIIMWSVANEPRSDLAEAKTYFESLLNYARKDLAKYTVQANRPLTAAIAQSHQQDLIGQFLDVIMVNRYYGWYDYTGVVEAIRRPLIESLEGWSRKYPGKGLILSEFGADTVSGLHSSSSDLFSEEYQRKLVLEYEKVFDEITCKHNDTINFLGSMIWNFADFSTHDSLLRVGGNRKGIFNKDRTPKYVAEAVKNVYLGRLNKGFRCS